MHHKEAVKKTLKIFFYLIQIAIFTVAVSTLILAITIYLKSNDLIKLSIKYIAVTAIVSVLTAASCFCGYKAIRSKNRLDICYYLLFTLILMNLQAITALKSGLIPEKIVSWTNNRWNELDNSQKNHVQLRFKCCGFDNASDRPGSRCLGGAKGCLTPFIEISKSLRTIFQHILFTCFFVETLGMGILSVLKLRK